MKPSSFTANHVEQLARKHGVDPACGPMDEAAVLITRLSGDEISSDRTEDLLVALKRTGAIDGRQMLLLLDAHLNESASI